MADLETSRTKQLRKLASSLPGANQQVMSGLNAARDTQLQQSIQQASPQQGGQRTAQQLGAQSAAAGQQAALQTAGQAKAQAQQVGQLGQQQAGVESAQRIGQQERAVQGLQRQQGEKLSRLGEDVKNQLLDQQLTFRQDEAGRALMNERQTADWAAANARSEEEFLDYQQQAMQMSERKLQMLETASQRLTSAIQNGYIIEGQRMDNDTRRQILEQKAALDKKIEQERIARANKAAMWGAAGSIVGAVVGGAFGGGAGAQAGSEAGGATGTAGSYGF